MLNLILIFCRYKCSVKYSVINHFQFLCFYLICYIGSDEGDIMAINFTASFAACLAAGLKVPRNFMYCIAQGKFDSLFYTIIW